MEPLHAAEGRGGNAPAQGRPTPAATAELAVLVTGVSKAFGGVRALDQVDWEVRRGEIHALVGGNGSGKSTLIKILAGVYTADPGGSISFGGQSFPADDVTATIAHRCGLRFVHQALGLFPDLSVAENLAAPNGFSRNRLGGIQWRTVHRRAAELLEAFAIPARPQQPLSDLRPAHRTMVAVARALRDEQDTSGGASVLVLDEPTALLPYEEVETLLDAVRGYAQGGRTIVYISHRLDEVLDIADTVTVLRDGHRVITRPTDGLDESGLVQHIVGRELGALYPSVGGHAAGRPVCELRGLRGGPVRDVNLEIRRSEIVGLAGVVGSGCTEVLEMTFGARSTENGAILIDGEPIAMRSPADAIAAGVAYVPADRTGDAAFLDLSVRENLFAGTIGRGTRWGHVGKRAERRDAQRLMARFLVRAESADSLLSSLSGGNQQKVIVSRWLAREPKLLLMNEPTQGVDVGSRAEIYGLIRQAADEGMAVAISSADFDEMAHLCDRVLVLSDGEIVAELTPPALTSHTLTEAVLLGRQDNNGGQQ